MNCVPAGALIDASATEPLHCVVTRTGLDPVVVNLELAGVVDDPEQVAWVDPSHGGS